MKKRNYYNFKTFRGGLSTLFKDYQELTLRYLWTLEEGEGAGSAQCWKHVSEILKAKERTISRASIIFFLDDLVDYNIIRYISKSGKGGYRRIYSPIYTETEFKEHIAKIIISKLMYEFPDATKSTISKMQRGTE